MASPSKDFKSGWSYKKGILFSSLFIKHLDEATSPPACAGLGKLGGGGEPGTGFTELTGQGGPGAGAIIDHLGTWDRPSEGGSV